jgi:N-methylhydantoinase B
MFLEPGEISIHDDRWLTHPWGVNGGHPGGRSNKIMVRANGTEEKMHAKCDRIKVEPGDVLYFNTWGGGGWGDPLKRDALKVAKDADRGLVTIEGARRYGVVVRGDYSLDETATTSLRQRMERERGDLKLFDFGGTVEELKARCKAETGFDPPRTPEFQKWVRGVQAAAAE